MIELRILPWAPDGNTIVSPDGGDEARAIIEAQGPQILELAKCLLAQHHGTRAGDLDAGLTLTIEFRPSLWHPVGQ